MHGVTSPSLGRRSQLQKSSGSLRKTRRLGWSSQLGSWRASGATGSPRRLVRKHLPPRFLERWFARGLLSCCVAFIIARECRRVGALVFVLPRVRYALVGLHAGAEEVAAGVRQEGLQVETPGPHAIDARATSGAGGGAELG